jgi:stage II sporulation protein GA (sporulation sigma-E factor processing peptidase)
MYEEIYIDAVFVTNLLMDYILLRILGKLFRCRRNRKRSFIAAALGALFSCLILYVPAEGFPWAAVLCHGACAYLMVRIACNIKKGRLLLKAMAALYLMGFLTGGFWEAVASDFGYAWRTFFLLAGITYISLSVLVYLSDSVRIQRKNIYPVTLSYGGRVQSAYGFYDTGNLLAEPVTGRPVSLVKPELLEALLSGESAKQLKHLRENPGEAKSTELAGLHPRFVPYRTVGTGQGMLLAVTLEDLCIHTPREVVHVENPVFALSYEPSALGQEYKVLLNSRLLQEEGFYL